MPANRDRQAERDHHIDQRSGQRNDQLLPRFFRHPFQSRDTTDRQQCDVRGVDAESFRGKRVPKFVQDHAQKK